MSVVRTLVKTVAGTLDLVRRPPAGLVVLLYHRVGGRTPVSVDLPTGLFDEQMAVLASEALVVGLDEAVDRHLAGEDLSGHVCVTFDDGTADIVDTALPVLERHGVPATVFVASAHLDEGRDFPDEGRVVSWAALADAASTGLLTVESHTHAHLLCDRVDPDALADDLDRSIGTIGEHLGRRPRHLAYPKALAPTPTAVDVVRRRFVSAWLAGTRANRPGGDPLRLRRSPVQTGDGMTWFRRKLAGGMGFEDDLRRLLDRRRHAGAVA